MDLPPYKRPWYLYNAHLETIWPSLFRRVGQPPFRRERINTSDDDFLDLDWLHSGSERLVIISHGLEGNSRRAYVVGMANTLAKRGWDVLAWNFRGCGGEINRQPRFTHNGATDDLDAVVRHSLKTYAYKIITLVGFSMGGNLSLVYLGKDPDRVPDEVKAAVCFSVPGDLAASSLRLSETRNTLYMRRFMRLMGEKVLLLSQGLPDHVSYDDYSSLRTFSDFDGRYTAPMHGFRDAQDYWEQCSCNNYLSEIRQPIWIINALNDPFLPMSCYPDVTSHGNSNVTLMTPEHGGHCGFSPSGNEQSYWSEYAASKLLSLFS